MSASIGAYNFISLKGNINPGTGENLELITRPNVHGIAYRKTGKRGEPFSMVSTVDVADAASAKTTLLNYKALQGTLQTVTEESASQWTNVAVLTVQEVSNRPILQAAGGFLTNPAFLLTVRWTMQQTEYS